MGERKLKDVSQKEQIYAVEFGPTRERSRPPWLLIGLGIATVALVGAAFAFLGLVGDDGDPGSALLTTTASTLAPEPPAETSAPTSEAAEAPQAGVASPLDDWTLTSIELQAGEPAISYAGGDGYLLAYQDLEAENIRIASCRDPACRASAGAVIAPGGAEPSVAIGGDGSAIVSFRDVANGGLAVGHCADEACSAVVVSVVDPDPAVAGATPSPSGPTCCRSSATTTRATLRSRSPIV